MPKLLILLNISWKYIILNVTHDPKNAKALATWFFYHFTHSINKCKKNINHISNKYDKLIGSTNIWWLWTYYCCEIWPFTSTHMLWNILLFDVDLCTLFHYNFAVTYTITWCITLVFFPPTGMFMLTCSIPQGTQMYPFIFYERLFLYRSARKVCTFTLCMTVSIHCIFRTWELLVLVHFSSSDWLLLQGEELLVKREGLREPDSQSTAGSLREWAVA